MSETATRNLLASAESKRAVSEHAQEHAPPFRAAVLDKAAGVNQLKEKLWLRKTKAETNKGTERKDSRDLFTTSKRDNKKV